MEDEKFISERVRQLGFKPQSEIVYNRLLPYADQLDNESKKLFLEIKTNLIRAVLLRELHPGCTIWSARLAEYIKIYGFKFPKEDHVALVNLLYEIVTIPDLDPYLVNKFALKLIILLKKKHLLSPDDITLEWRPLYNLCKRVMYLKRKMYRYFSSLESTLDFFVHSAKTYFPETATQEILDELKPELNPLNCPSKAMEYLEWFLPVSLPPGKAHLGYKLWLTDIMDLWATCNNAPVWETEVMRLVANLASRNIGYIDWEPYIPVMFTRFLRAFNLPVVYKKCQAQRLQKIEIAPMALWIASVLGQGNSCQKYLDKFLKTIESYCHPANLGVWFLKLKEFLGKLPQYFIQRLHYERYKKLTWETPVPDSHKLTEEDIDRFVESMKGIATQAVFSKLGCTDASIALQHLATLRPKMVIPPLIDRLYATLDSVTEPHKLTSLMQCVTLVARPLVQGPQFGYPEGPTHVIPLLKSILPGIDANDFKKSMVTIQLMSVLVTLVPLVDSSKAGEHWPDLTKEEAIVCAATADFEDFVEQFFDGFFNFIVNSSLELFSLEKVSSKRSRAEILAEKAIYTISYLVLCQCSTAIFKTMLHKLEEFVMGRIIEMESGGHLVAALCRAFSQVNPEKTLELLLPQLCDSILFLTESEDARREELIDEELHYNLFILSELIECHGISPYVPRLLEVLDATLHLSSREGFTKSSRLLNSLLQSLTTIRPLEKRSLPVSYDSHVKDFLPVRDWGKPGNVHKLNLRWHTPGEKEVEWVEKIVMRYLPAELEKIRKHVSDEEPLTRDQLLCSLGIVLGIFGAQLMLPMWDEEPLTLCESGLKVVAMSFTLGVKGEVRMANGENVRQVVSQLMSSLQKKLLACAEDDIRSLLTLIKIWERLLLNKVWVGNDLEELRKDFQLAKKVLENPLIGKQHVRVMLINRVILQHELRSERGVSCLTETHKTILLNLLELSCSHYSKVRIKAQNALFQGLNQFPYSYTVLIPDLLKNLQENSTANEEKFKGSLYVLLGPKQRPIISRQDWDLLLKVWPTLIRVKPSEKLSVVGLLDSLVYSVKKHFPTVTINLPVPDGCIEKAKILRGTGSRLSSDAVTDAQTESARRDVELKSRKNEDLYLAALNSLMDAIDENNLHWRYHSMALHFLSCLVHPEVAYPARAVKIFLGSLINDSIALRKIAIKSTLHLLTQQKRQSRKLVRSVTEMAGCPVPETLTPGIRPDNLWLQYNSATIPKSPEEWDAVRYWHKPLVGYYQWPKEMKPYAPSGDQPPLDRDHSELRPEEKEVEDFFSNPGNVAQLIKYLSLEEEKGKDKFCWLKFLMFKKLFRNHGDSFLSVFRPHLETLVADKHESSQRCAAEVIAGLIRGCKNWPFEKVSALWSFLGPLIRTALSNMTEETVPDWGSCFARAAQNRDPNRNHWLLEILMEDPLREESSFLGCGRLFVLQNALNQQEWRVSELCKRLLEYLEPFLNHPFQNVREKVASMLTNIFESDIRLPGGNVPGPHPESFLSAVVPRLEILHSLSIVSNVRQEDTKLDNSVINKTAEGLESFKFFEAEKKPHNSVGDDSSEKEVAIRLLKTVCTWIIRTLTRSHRCALPEFYSVFPFICLLENYDQNEELAGLCSLTLAALARAGTAPGDIPTVFSSISKEIHRGSWWARSALAAFLQVFVFHNMPLVLSSPVWTTKTSAMAIMLLEDERVEVRERAAELLAGLLHCDFVEDMDELLEYFKTKVNVKTSKLTSKNSKTLTEIHSGILGLCAFINSSPYDVPDYVPEIFYILECHLNDPQPIPSTIRKTLGDFKRTHHDNWERHQLKFTELQLEILNDLNVPPSCYA